MDPKKVHRRQNDPVEIERTSVSVAIPRAHKLRIIPRSFAQKFGDCHPAVQSHAPFNATAWPALCSELRSTEATDTYSQSMPAGSRMGPPHIGARHTELCPGSAVSPAWLAVSSPQTNSAACPWCTADPTFLGPTKNTPEDQVLQWLTHVQGLIWQERYS